MTGYTLLVTCETGAGCVGAGSLVAWSWKRKIELICDDIGEGKLTYKEGSKKFLISLVTTPVSGIAAPAVGLGLISGPAGNVANYLLNLAIQEAYFEPLEDCY
jgi:hypothetical protein